MSPLHFLLIHIFHYHTRVLVGSLFYGISCIVLYLMPNFGYPEKFLFFILNCFFFISVNQLSFEKLIWRGFSSLVNSIKNVFQKSHYATTWTDVRLYYVELLLARYYLFIYGEENFIIVSSLRVRRLITPNIAEPLNRCPEKKVSTSTVMSKLCDVGLYGRIVTKKPLLRKKNNVERFQRA